MPPTAADINTLEFASVLFFCNWVRNFHSISFSAECIGRCWCCNMRRRKVSLSGTVESTVTISHSCSNKAVPAAHWSPILNSKAAPPSRWLAHGSQHSNSHARTHATTYYTMNQILPKASQSLTTYGCYTVLDA